MLPPERLECLYQQVKFCLAHAVAGAFVECGVWKGGSVGMMALAAGGRSGNRQLHLFDSFTDICEPDPAIDGVRAINESLKFAAPSGELQPMRGFYADVGGHGTKEACQGLIEDKIGYPAHRVFYHAGWFQDTLPNAKSSIGPIAILRLDGDWYESTKVCLDHLYDLVVTGGFVIIDDYGTYEGCRRAVDEFLTQRQIRAYLQEVDAGCRYFVKI
jgi:O-methyltransferase